jgi:hypothetical protein
MTDVTVCPPRWHLSSPGGMPRSYDQWSVDPSQGSETKLHIPHVSLHHQFVQINVAFTLRWKRFWPCLTHITAFCCSQKGDTHPLMPHIWKPFPHFLACPCCQTSNNQVHLLHLSTMLHCGNSPQLDIRNPYKVLCDHPALLDKLTNWQTVSTRSSRTPSLFPPALSQQTMRPRRQSDAPQN